MMLKRSFVLFCVIFAIGVLGASNKKASSKKEAQDNDKGNYGELKNYEGSSRRVRQLPYYYDEYSNQNSYSQSQYYNNGPQNGNDYGTSGQDDYGYGQNGRRPTGHKTLGIGNGRGNTNVVAISGSDPSYVVGYSEPSYDYNQYDRRGSNYPSSKGNSFIAVNQRNGRPDTVLLSSKSKNGQQSTLVVSKEGVNINVDPSYENYPNNDRGYYGQQTYNPKGHNNRQRQEYASYY